MIGGLCLGRDGVHLDTKGTRGDGVGDTGQYPSWHSRRKRRVIYGESYTFLIVGRDVEKAVTPAILSKVKCILAAVLGGVISYSVNAECGIADTVA